MKNYQLGVKLDSGSMSRVYRAQDTRLNRLVAVKVIKGSFAENPEFIRRFQHEARLYARLEHPNIVEVYDAEMEDGSPYIVMELLEGTDLRKHLQRGSLPVEEAVRIIKAVLSALTKAHSERVIHRDIKAANVFLCDDGVVKVLDFGIAKALDSTHLTGTGETLGTPDYMSPEQAEGQPADARSDLYSVGILLYYMLAGRLPFESPDPFAVMLMHAEQPPPDLPLCVPDGLQEIVDRALAKKPEERFQSAEEMLAALEKPAAFQNAAPAKIVQDNRIPVFIAKSIYAMTALLCLSMLGFPVIWKTMWAVSASSPRHNLQSITHGTGVEWFDRLIDRLSNREVEPEEASLEEANYSDIIPIQTWTAERARLEFTIKKVKSKDSLMQIGFEDELGDHPAILKQAVNKGDKISLDLEYLGNHIRLYAYYNGTRKWELNDFDPQEFDQDNIDDLITAQQLSD